MNRNDHILCLLIDTDGRLHQRLDVVLEGTLLEIPKPLPGGIAERAADRDNVPEKGVVLFCEFCGISLDLIHNFLLTPSDMNVRPQWKLRFEGARTLKYFPVYDTRPLTLALSPLNSGNDLM